MKKIIYSTLCLISVITFSSSLSFADNPYPDPCPGPYKIVCDIPNSEGFMICHCELMPSNSSEQSTDEPQ